MTGPKPSSAPFVYFTDEFPKYHAMDHAWSCGAACVQMILGVAPEATRKPFPKQSDLFKEIARATSSDIVDWTGGPDGMESVLREHIPDATKNYMRVYRKRKYDIEKWIAYSICEYHRPAIVLTGTSRGYSHWVLVHGCLLDKKYTGTGKNAATIKGFFIHTPMLPLTEDTGGNGDHNQNDSCGRPSDAGSNNVSLYHFVDIREWRRQYMAKAIPTFEGRTRTKIEGRNFVTLVYNKLGDNTVNPPISFRDDEAVYAFQASTEAEPLALIGEEAAAKNAVDHVNELGLFNIAPWKEVIGANLANVVAKPNDFAIVHYVDRLDVHDTKIIDPDKVENHFWHPYYLVRIKTDTDKSAIAVIIDGYDGSLLETIAVPDPHCNVLSVPSRQEISDIISENLRKVDTTADKPPSYIFTRIVTVENAMPTWRTEDIYSDIVLRRWGEKDKFRVKLNRSGSGWGLVWSPSTETTSRFYPLYWLVHNSTTMIDENVYVRIDTPLAAAPGHVHTFTEINPIGYSPELPRSRAFNRYNQYRNRIRRKPHS